MVDLVIYNWQKSELAIKYCYKTGSMVEQQITYHTHTHQYQ